MQTEQACSSALLNLLTGGLLSIILFGAAIFPHWHLPEGVILEHRLLWLVALDAEIEVETFLFDPIIGTEVPPKYKNLARH